MKVIAISYSGFDNVVGNIFIAGVMLDETIFNTFPTYWSRRMLSIRLNRGVFFEKTNVMENSVIRRTRKKEGIPELMIEVLNSFKKFWEYPIYIESPYENIIELMSEKLPHNLKVNNIDLKNCKFHFTLHKSLTAAWAIADEFKFQEEDILKKIWGDFGENKIECETTKRFLEEHKDCPHIKETYKIKENENDTK